MRLSPNILMTVLLMWLLPLCTVINSGLELLVIPGNAPKIATRWNHDGETNSIYAEKGVHHIPPAHRHARHHQLLTATATAPPKKVLPERIAFYTDRLQAPAYRAAFPYDCFQDIAVPPPEEAC